MNNPFEQGVAYNVRLYDWRVEHGRITHMGVTYVGQLDDEYVFRTQRIKPNMTTEAMLLAVFPTDIAQAVRRPEPGKLPRGYVVPVHRRECSKRGDPSTLGHGHVCNTEYERARWAS